MAAAAIFATASISPAFAESQEGGNADLYAVLHTYSALSGAPAPTTPAMQGSIKAEAGGKGKRPARTALRDGGQKGAYAALIAKHAEAAGVPVALADAVVRIESRYNPRAHNGGAVGLMQIKPQTARGLGYAGGAGGLTDPETNLRYGMLYLAQAYRMSGGNTCGTVMRYQSGHFAKSLNGANRAYCAKARTIMASNG